MEKEKYIDTKKDKIKKLISETMNSIYDNDIAIMNRKRKEINEIIDDVEFDKGIKRNKDFYAGLLIGLRNVSQLISEKEELKEKILERKMFLEKEFNKKSITSQVIKFIYKEEVISIEDIINKTGASLEQLKRIILVERKNLFSVLKPIGKNKTELDALISISRRNEDLIKEIVESEKNIEQNNSKYQFKNCKTNGLDEKTNKKDNAKYTFDSSKM